MFISEVVGAEKPSLDFFRPVLEAIGPYDREELLLIGDSLTSDMEGGSRAGIPCCWYNPKGLPRPDRPVIRYEAPQFEPGAGDCGGEMLRNREWGLCYHVKQPDALQE